MTKLLRFELGDGDSVLVEVDENEPGMTRASRAKEVVEAAASSLGSALAGVRKAASEAVRRFRDMDARPDEVQIEFGVRLNAQAGAVIAKSGVDGHLKVKLTWRRMDGPVEGEQSEETTEQGEDSSADEH
ncbi:MAG TPA: CU044_2847 family protein [Pseudonocardiaceae bacterium]